MLKKDLILNLFCLILVFFTLSCNAPRDNPLDPNGPNADLVQIKPNLGQIEGTVQTSSAPLTGIDSVYVFWIKGNTVVTTNDSGNFIISNIKPEEGDLYFQKDGYTPDTVHVIWNNNKNIKLKIVNLNKKPTLESYSIYSEVVNQSAQSNTTINQMANLVFKVKINDSDNDIDSVYVENDMLNNFTGGLELQGKLYQGTFTPAKLNVPSLDETVGYSFNVWVIDTFGRSFLVGSNRVTRVIKSGVNIISPNNDSSAISLPIDLIWSQYENGFDFHYKVEIFSATNPQAIFTQDSIRSDQTTLQINTTSVVAGDYIWAVSVVDKFFDSYKSQPGRFRIK